MAKAPSLIVAKVGSSTLVDENGALDRTFIRSLCDQVVELAHEVRTWFSSPRVPQRQAGTSWGFPSVPLTS